jgi:curved DNA-binding protein CbpA
MGSPAPDPYETLGVRANVTDAELRAAYRRAVQRHHPDHNGGSAQSARRFEDIQDAYARIRTLRATRRPDAARPADGPNLDSRLDDIERELAAAREANERARRASREAASAATDARSRARASDEELGYVTTDDSLGKIFTDAASRLSEQFSEVRNRATEKTPGAGVTERVADVLDEISARLRGEPPKR